MHKKSIETSPGKASSLTPPPAPMKEKPEGKTMEEKNETHTKDANSPISKEELRENSIAALRAKAQEHSAKVFGAVSDRTNGRAAREEEAEDKSMDQGTAEEEKGD